MSQQTIFIAICLVAGLAAHASAQTIDGVQCMNNINALITSYTSTMSKSIQDYVDSVSKTAGNSVDVDGLRESSQQIMQALADFGQIDVSKGVSIQDIVKRSSSILMMEAGLVKYFDNPIDVMAATGFVANLAKSNAEFSTSAMRACIPGSRSSN